MRKFVDLWEMAQEVTKVGLVDNKLEFFILRDRSRGKYCLTLDDIRHITITKDQLEHRFLDRHPYPPAFRAGDMLLVIEDDADLFINQEIINGLS